MQIRQVKRAHEYPPGCDHDPSDGRDRNVSVVVGVDTVSFAWRPAATTTWETLTAAARRGSLTSFDPYTRTGRTVEIIPSARRSYLIREPVGGVRFGFFPEHELIWCEGRLAALCAGVSSASGLRPPSLLSHAAALAALSFEQLGMALLGEAPVVRRLDLAADLKFDDPALGLRFLRAAAGLPVANLKTDVWSHGGRIETVYLRSPASGHTKVRFYDRGRLDGSHPGSTIRIERQLRFQKAAQLDPSAVAKSDLGAVWEGELRAWRTLSGQAVVGDLVTVQRAVAEAAEREGLSPLCVERLVGWLALSEQGFDRTWWKARGKPHIPARRAAELRTLGIAFDPTAPPTSPELRVSVAETLAAVAAEWRSC